MVSVPRFFPHAHLSVSPFFCFVGLVSWDNLAPKENLPIGFYSGGGASFETAPPPPFKAVFFFFPFCICFILMLFPLCIVPLHLPFSLVMSYCLRCFT